MCYVVFPTSGQKVLLKGGEGIQWKAKVTFEFLGLCTWEGALLSATDPQIL